MKRIYLDNSATTPMCKEALDAYTAVATESYGNPSSRHRMGQEALAIIREAEKEDFTKCNFICPFYIREI